METSAGDRMRRAALRPLLFVLGGYHLLLGLVIAVAPRTFYDRVAGFPPYNAHFLRDVAAFYVALGVVTLVAAGRRSWQLPVLAFTLLQYALHVVNHLVDADESDPGWHGPVNVVTLAAIGAAVWWLLRRVREDERR